MNDHVHSHDEEIHEKHFACNDPESLIHHGELSMHIQYTIIGNNTIFQVTLFLLLKINKLCTTL